MVNAFHVTRSKVERRTSETSGSCIDTKLSIEPLAPASISTQGDPSVAALIAADQPSGLPETGYWTAKQVQAYFGISNSTYYAWVAASLLPAPVMIGPRARRQRVEALRASEAVMLARLRKDKG